MHDVFFLSSVLFIHNMYKTDTVIFQCTVIVGDGHPYILSTTILGDTSYILKIEYVHASQPVDKKYNYIF